MYNSHIISDYDRVIDANHRRAAERLEEHAHTYSKGRDTRGLEVIAAALAAARTAAGGAEHVDQWADRAWQLALEMFGSEGEL